VANFVLIHFSATPGKTAAEADTFLSARGLILRRVVGLSPANCLRMTVGGEEANRLVVTALTEFLGKKA